MNPALFVRASVRRGLFNQSLRSYVSKPPSQTAKDEPGSSPSQDAAVPKTEPAAQESGVDSKAEASFSSLPSLDFAPGEEPHRERTGAKSSKDSLSSIERKRRLWGRVSAGVMLFGIAAAVYHSGREWEEDELKEMRMVRFVNLDRGR